MKPDMLVMLDNVEYKVVSPVNAWLLEDSKGAQVEAFESTLVAKEESSDEASVETSVEDILKMSVEEFKAYKESFRK